MKKALVCLTIGSLLSSHAVAASSCAVEGFDWLTDEGIARDTVYVDDNLRGANLIFSGPNDDADLRIASGLLDWYSPSILPEGAGSFQIARQHASLADYYSYEYDKETHEDGVSFSIFYLEGSSKKVILHIDNITTDTQPIIRIIGDIAYIFIFEDASYYENEDLVSYFSGYIVKKDDILSEMSCRYIIENPSNEGFLVDDDYGSGISLRLIFDKMERMFASEAIGNFFNDESCSELR